MSEFDLSRPVRDRVRIIQPVDAADSLAHVAQKFRETGLESLPVAHAGGIIGHVTQHSLVRALAGGLESTSAVGSVLVHAVPLIGCNESAASALRRMHETGAPMLLVTDETDRVMGVVTPADFLAHHVEKPYPGPVGGMATPFGVYLTDGVLTAGARGWPLVATGALLMFFHVLAGVVTYAVFDQPWLRHLGLSTGAQETIIGVAWTALFFAGIRLAPLSGIHAAEHMTVHAIERRESLVPAVVARMPRIHPRCGTNLVAGVMVYLTVAQRQWFGDPQLQLLAAAVAALSLWRPLGSLLQRYVTTRPPTEKHIALGIQAGQELLDQFAARPHGRPNFGQRILSSGIFQVLAGSMTLTMVLYWASRTIPALRFLQVYF